MELLLMLRELRSPMELQLTMTTPLHLKLRNLMEQKLREEMTTRETMELLLMLRELRRPMELQLTMTTPLHLKLRNLMEHPLRRPLVNTQLRMEEEAGRPV